MKADEEVQAAQAASVMDVNERGGSFSLEPAFFLPATPLDKTLHNTLGWNLNFDIGFSPRWSVIFGAAYADFKGQQNPDYHLMLVPAWFGVKSKNQFLPAVEVFWEGAAEIFYEKAYMVNSSVGAMQNLDGGAFLGAGFDIWWTRWLLTGVQSRIHFIVESQQIFPVMQLGLRVGIRG